MPAFIDLKGKRFGRLTVLRRVRKSCGGTHWSCQCECGERKTISAINLSVGDTNSCGCIHKEMMKEKMRIVGAKSHVWKVPPVRAAENRIFCKYRTFANRRNKAWSLSFEEFQSLIYSPCFYCGRPPHQKMWVRGEGKEILYTGIDRINSSLGYTIDSALSSCGTCNRMKMDMNISDFLFHIGMINATSKFKKVLRAS